MKREFRRQPTTITVPRKKKLNNLSHLLIKNLKIMTKLLRNQKTKPKTKALAMTETPTIHQGYPM